MMNLKELKELIEIVSQKGFAEFEIERQGFRLRISHFKETPGPTDGRSTASEAPFPKETFSLPARLPNEHAGVEASETSKRSWHEQQPQPRRPAPTVAAEPTVHVIKSPIVGTFFRAAAPTSEPFVKVGDSVGPDTVVCIIEAMKLMNEIQADISGEVVQIYAENGQAVEYDQALFGIRAQ
jgi:acetyl-CoA carboxylase biotin carboxyl carrier protein